MAVPSRSPRERAVAADRGRDDRRERRDHLGLGSGQARDLLVEPEAVHHDREREAHEPGIVVPGVPPELLQDTRKAARRRELRAHPCTAQLVVTEAGLPPHLEERAVVVEQLDVHPDDALDCVRRPLFGNEHHLVDHLVHPDVRLGADREQHIAFGREVRVEGRPGNAGSFDDVVDRRSEVPLLKEDLARLVDNERGRPLRTRRPMVGGARETPRSGNSARGTRLGFGAGFGPVTTTWT